MQFKLGNYQSSWFYLMLTLGFILFQVQCGGSGAQEYKEFIVKMCVQIKKDFLPSPHRKDLFLQEVMPLLPNPAEASRLNQLYEPSKDPQDVILRKNLPSEDIHFAFDRLHQQGFRYPEPDSVVPRSKANIHEILRKNLNVINDGILDVRKQMQQLQSQTRLAAQPPDQQLVGLKAAIRDTHGSGPECLTDVMSYYPSQMKTILIDIGEYLPLAKS